MDARGMGQQSSRSSGLTARWLFTGRSGGVSKTPYESLNISVTVGDDPVAVEANRVTMAEATGLEPGSLVVMRAVHGNSVAVVTEPGLVAEGDALITQRIGLGVVATSADCVPIALCDPSTGLVAAVHSGWRGVVVNAVGAAVAAMSDLGADPERITAAIGPAICPGCYEVSKGVLMEVSEIAPDVGSRTRKGTPALDVQAGVAQQLHQAGVRDIRTDDRCTFENPGNFFSYRRDGVTGRQGVVVSLGEPGS